MESKEAEKEIVKEKQMPVQDVKVVRQIKKMVGNTPPRPVRLKREKQVKIIWPGMSCFSSLLLRDYCSVSTGILSYIGYICTGKQ